MPDISDWGMCEVRDAVECLTSLTKVCGWVSDTVEHLTSMTGVYVR